MVREQELKEILSRTTARITPSRVKNQQKDSERIDPLLFHALSFKANACFGHTDLFTVTSAVDPYAYGIRVSVFSPNE